MQLNTTNGHIIIGDLHISSELQISKIENLIDQYSIKKIQNGDYVSYLIPDVDDGEYALSILFFKEKLNSVNIELGKKYNFPPFIITSDERKMLEKKLKQLGGNNEYFWGNVRIVNDTKGGVLSIMIKYNR